MPESLNAAAGHVGLHNEREFYSDHYLAELLGSDLRPVVARWRAEAAAGEDRSDAPDVRLGALAGEHRRIREAFRRAGDDGEAVRIQRRWFRLQLEALGHRWAPAAFALETGEEIPVLGEAEGVGGRLLALGAYAPDADGDDPLELRPHAAQFAGEAPPSPDVLGETWDTILTRRVFGAERPPRWALLLSIDQTLLLERGKWAQRRLLRFDWRRILDRREGPTLRAAAALLHRESALPGSGAALLDALDERSHRHAFGVSGELRHALREAVELLGDEALRSLRSEAPGAEAPGGDLAERLGTECLRYLYRLLFLFCSEARPELGYAPVDAEAYRRGYGLERLRDLEMARLETARDRDGQHIRRSLDRLFQLVREGFEPAPGGQRRLTFEERTLHGTFRMEPLDSRLFDPARTPLLGRARLRDEVMQRVLRLLSLTRPAQGRRRRGRISYGQLGIGHLGGVYEALLSFRGSIAREDLYEVQVPGSVRDELEPAWFVTAEALAQYTEEERVHVRDERGRRRLLRHPKGRFLFRRTGRERERTASFYTPEPLTRAVVRQALEERIDAGMPAARILQLRVCEPAMGSAAFLNEAVNQLAERYLERRQRELGRRIPPGERAEELQRARHHIADRNVFGVDLNPVAVELAEVSLWLNCLVQDGHVPWFGYQLFAGNSLVGARRRTYPRAEIAAGRRGGARWFGREPDAVGRGPAAACPAGAVYHFLLPDPGMSRYGDRFVRQLAPQPMAALRAWRKAFCRPFGEADADELERLSQAADRLWALHAEQLAQDRAATEDATAVWGAEHAERRTANGWKETIRGQGVFGTRARTASPYRRLKLVLDYWCALWFWPIEAKVGPPSREEFLTEASIVLTGDVRDAADGPGQAALQFGEEYAAHAAGMARRILDETGLLDLERLCELFPRLGFVDALAERMRFLHWDLAFADIFYGTGPDGEPSTGFDLVLGNPPWIKLSWDEAGVIGDFEPSVVVRRRRAAALRRERPGLLARSPGLRAAYLDEYAATEATKAYLGAPQNYTLLQGMQANSYKCFLPQAWSVLGERGVAGLLHPEGLFDDPRGGALRAAVYARLRAHFQFQNARKLFADVGDRVRFSVNVYGPERGRPGFVHMANLFAAETIEASSEHPGTGPVPGIKRVGGGWETDGHAGRMVRVGPRELETFAAALDPAGTPAGRARLPAVHSTELMSLLRKFAGQPRRLRDLAGQFACGVIWDETNAQRDGTIRRETRFPREPREWILSGPAPLRRQPARQDPPPRLSAEERLRLHRPDGDPGRLPAAHELRPGVRPRRVRAADSVGAVGRGRSRRPKPEGDGPLQHGEQGNGGSGERANADCGDRAHGGCLHPCGCRHEPSRSAGSARLPGHLPGAADGWLRQDDRGNQHNSGPAAAAAPLQAWTPSSTVPARARARPALPHEPLPDALGELLGRRARRRRLDPFRCTPERGSLGRAGESVEPRLRAADGLRATPGAGGGGRAGGDGARAHPRRAAGPLQSAVPGPARVRGGHVVRPGWPDRLHHLAGTLRHGPSQEGEERGFQLWTGAAGPERDRTRARLGGRPGAHGRNRLPDRRGRHAAAGAEGAHDRVPRALRPVRPGGGVSGCLGRVLAPVQVVESPRVWTGPGQPDGCGLARILHRRGRRGAGIRETAGQAARAARAAWGSSTRPSTGRPDSACAAATASRRSTSATGSCSSSCCRSTAWRPSAWETICAGIRRSVWPASPLRGPACPPPWHPQCTRFAN